MKRNIWVIALIVLIAIATACTQPNVQLPPTPPEINTYAVSLDVTGEAILVEVGTEAPSTINAVVTYSDGSTQNCNAAVSAVDTATAGAKTATASYDGVSTEFTLFVYETENVVDSSDELASVIGSAADGDIIVLSGNIEAPSSPIALSTTGARIIGDGSAKITTDANDHVFQISGSDNLIEGIEFVTEATAGTTNIINVSGENAIIRNCTFTGNYDADGNPDVTSRGLELSNAKNILIEGCSFINVRQPAYINDGPTGIIRDNIVTGTRGWVVGSNTELTFEGNEFENNAVDIAFIDATGTGTTTNNYSAEDCVAISKANNNCYVQNQILKIDVIGDSVESY